MNGSRRPKRLALALAGAMALAGCAAEGPVSLLQLNVLGTGFDLVRFGDEAEPVVVDTYCEAAARIDDTRSAQVDEHNEVHAALCPQAEAAE